MTTATYAPTDASGDVGSSTLRLGPGPTVYFRRVEYPFEDTIAKIYAAPELDNFLGDRLRDGR
jgi:hypothetical protein